MKQKPKFAKVRYRMAELGITQFELAIEIDRTPCYVSRALSGKSQLTLKDVWGIMQTLGILREDMGEYFGSM